MYYKEIETSREAKASHNRARRAEASERLKKVSAKKSAKKKEKQNE